MAIPWMRPHYRWRPSDAYLAAFLSQLTSSPLDSETGDRSSTSPFHDSDTRFHGPPHTAILLLPRKGHPRRSGSAKESSVRFPAVWEISQQLDRCHGAPAACPPADRKSTRL